MKQESPYTVHFTVQQICDLLKVKLPKQYQYLADEVPTNLAYSRNYLLPGSAFFLDGKPELRKTRLAKALKAGAMVVFTNSTETELPELAQIPHIPIKNASTAVMRIGKAIRAGQTHKVIGITGSLGKTTTKEMVQSVLSQKYVARKSAGNQNGHRPVFELLQKVPKNTEYYVQEFGAGQFHNMLSISARICTPDAAVITCIAHNHLDVFGTQANILDSKSKLITHMADGCPAFLNYDDPLLRELKVPGHPIISFAVNNKDADYYAENVEVIEDYMTFDIVYRGGRIPVQLNTPGLHNVGNALVSAAIGHWAGLSDGQIADGIAAFHSQGIRQSLTDVGGYNLYIDCYNTGPIPLMGAIRTLEQIPVAEGGKRIAVIAEMGSLGARAEAFHREVGEMIGRSNLDLVLCYGNELAELMANTIRAQDKAVLYSDKREDLNTWMRQLITRKDVTLIKGANARLLHKSIDQVYGTSFHLSVNYEYFSSETDGVFNYKVISEMDQTTKSVGITKYLGSEAEVTLPAGYDGVDAFCVAPNCFLQNATLRKAVIPAPIFNISAGAFRACKELKQVTLPDTMKGIGAKAFYACSALKEIVIPEGVIDIGDEAFAKCTALKRVVLPASLGRIGENAFAGCPNAVFKCPEGSYAEEYVQKNGL